MRTCTRLRPAFAVALCCILPAAHAGKAHVHGAGRLDVAIDRNVVTLHLELPLDATVGFERAPQNDKEKAALAATERTLREAASLFRPTPAAGCEPRENGVTVGMPRFDDGGHADIEASYHFSCTTPDALKQIETTIFRSFRRLYRLEVQYTGPGGQGAQRLTPRQPVLAW